MKRRALSPQHVLVLLLVLSFLLRFLHVNYATPIVVNHDESGSGILASLNMLAQATPLIPKGSYLSYTGLTAYLYLPFLSVWIAVMALMNGGLEAVQEMVIIQGVGLLTPIGRLVSHFSSVVTLYFVYRIGKRSVGPRWALLAVALASLNLVYLIESSFGRPWALVVMFSTIALDLVLQDMSPKLLKKRMLLFGALGGLAYASHLGGSFMFAILFLFAWRKHGKQVVWSLLSFGFIALLFLVLNPENLARNAHLFSSTFSGEEVVGGKVYTEKNILDRIFFYPILFLKFFPLESLFFFFALILGRFKDIFSRSLLLIFFGYYVVVGLGLAIGVSRYFVTAMPIFALLVTKAVKSFSYKKANWQQFTAIALVMAIPLWTAFFWTKALLPPSTTELTRDWLAENTSDEEWIISELDLGLSPSLTTLELMQDKLPHQYLNREKMLIELYGESPPVPSYNILNSRVLLEEDQSWMDDFSGYVVAVNEEIGITPASVLEFTEGKEPVARFTFEQEDRIKEESYRWFHVRPKSLINNHLHRQVPFLYFPHLLRSGPNISIYSL